MNASLPTRAKALLDRLSALDQLGDNVNESSLLNGLRSHLEPDAFKLSRKLDQRKLLCNSGIEVASPSSLEIARKNAAAILKKFAAEKRAATLKKGVGWTNLTDHTNAASREVDAAVKKSWDAYLQKIFTGEAPIVIAGRIAFTPANTTAFAEYKRRYQEFRAVTGQLPADVSEIDNVRRLAENLTRAASAFDFDVPVEVKFFLEAIQRGGAALELLTDAVYDWLKGNNAFESYHIVPRSTDGSR